MIHRPYRVFVFEREDGYWKEIHSKSTFASRNKAIERGWHWLNKGKRVKIKDTRTGAVIFSKAPRVDDLEELPF